ncbi:MAG TPA: VIT domain-containing protein [Draconibacterium sp.]|nr:VIT domain-containing protein [Draconibacterium sp.]
MKTTLLFIVLFFSLTNVFGYNQLRVGDPRNSWQTYQGTIEEASLTVAPKGLFMEFGLTLTFSSRGTIWTEVKDTLEVTLNFDLPENAMITDSWLWFGNDTIKAVILDRWTASSIYESIVNRRRDPSILFKQSANQYELRIFPMAASETRKVKITYLVPVSWNKTNITAGLPLPILKTSLTLPSKLTVITWEDEQWKNAVITGDESLSFTNKTDVNYGECKTVEIPSAKFSSNLKIGFDTPLLNGYYFSKYQTGDQGFYQLALSPAGFLNSTGAKKVAILVDYDVSNTNMKSLEILNILKEEMHNNLNPADSFNLIFSNLTILRHGEKWAQATFQNIESAFQILDNQLSSYSNLAALLANGIDFVNENGSDGKILLVSNSNQYSDYSVANKLIEDLLALMKTEIPIHIADYQALNYWYYYTDQNQYFGNGYFYSNLAKLTAGSYQNLQNGKTESDIFGLAFKYLHGSINSFDLHTTLENGFCYSRYNLNKDENVAYLNEMILQVGKFKGTFPFEINFSGEYNEEIFSEKIVIAANSQTENDSVVKKIWAGTFIKEMEKNYSTNDIVGEIIQESIDNRILSFYTSFLCLEDTSRWCLTCLPDQYKFENDGAVTGTDNFRELSDTVSVYPNPFMDNLSIEIQLTESSDLQDLLVYDLKGSLIYKFDKNLLNAGNKKTISWNGQSQNGEKLKSGIYLLVFRTAKISKTIKLVKQ